MKTERFFVADKGSPLHAELDRIIGVRRKGFAVLKKFMTKHGIDNMYGTNAANYLFDPKSGTDWDKTKWTKVKRPRGTWYLVPRKTTDAGKALLAEVKALPEMPTTASAINVVPGIGERLPMVVNEGTVHFPYIRFYNMKGSVIIELPSWKGKTKDPDKKLAQDWAPPPWLREVKEWEALKLIDEERS